MHLLLVEDDLELRAELQRALAGHGLTSEWVRGVMHARELTDDVHMRGSAQDSATPFACARLDLGLPDGQGIDLLRHWRRRGVGYCMADEP
jgi:two-component system, OmpR family, response regulator QseB